MESLVDVKITRQFIKYILSENFANNYNGKELLNVTYWCSRNIIPRSALYTVLTLQCTCTVSCTIVYKALATSRPLTQ